MLKNNLQTSASKIQELRKKEEGIPIYCSFKIVYLEQETEKVSILPQNYNLFLNHGIQFPA